LPWKEVKPACRQAGAKGKRLKVTIQKLSPLPSGRRVSPLALYLKL